MRRRGRAKAEQGGFAAVAIQYRREVVVSLLAVAATLTIFVNALFLQHGPHPAPFFATRTAVKQVQPPAPRHPDPATANRAQIVTGIQRELARHGFYDGTDDGIWGAKTDAAARDFAQAAALNINVEASDGFLRALSVSKVQAKTSRTAPAQATRDDPIARLIAPSKRIVAVQRALADFGYGQVKPTGVYDPETRAAVERFQHDRSLPVSGEVTDDFVRELAAVTGRPLE